MKWFYNFKIGQKVILGYLIIAAASEELSGQAQILKQMVGEFEIRPQRLL